MSRTALRLNWKKAFAKLPIPRIAVNGSWRFCERNPRSPGCASHCQEKTLHLRCELAPHRLFGGKGECPVSKGEKVAGGHKLIQMNVLLPHSLVRLEHGYGHAHN
jgi:hypothetical protein